MFNFVVANANDLYSDKANQDQIALSNINENIIMTVTAIISYTHFNFKFNKAIVIRR